eukprot:Hpha_TRINITY_DN14126_c0_g9::TRINITY_DN14126_c0_g9_i1::g.10695::m.10695
MERVFIACSGWFTRPSDSPEEREQKKHWVPICIIVAFIQLFYVIASYQQSDPLMVIANIVGLFCELTFLVIARFGCVSLGRGMDFFVLVQTLCVCLGDFSLAAQGSLRFWSIVVLLLDVALMFERDHMPPVQIAITMVYLAVERFESIYHVGIYDAADWGKSARKDIWDCMDPPCAVSFTSGFSSFMNFIIVLVFDYKMTHGFSKGLRQQLKVVEATVRVAASITDALARYETVNAERAIREEGEVLPLELKRSLLCLLSNLDQYKAYLPDALLHVDLQRQGSDILPPGVGQEDPSVAVVFTDIQSSTQHWEVCPQGMHDALAQHNAVLRELADELSGYEVKVIGDAMMLAFSNAENAVRFGVEAQQRLVDCNWPADLYKHPLCARVTGSGGQRLWNGLRVRVGVNYGPVRVERNPVTGRYDYFGQTVNVAARVESAVKKGGLTGVTQAVLEQVGVSHGVTVSELGNLDLRGMSTAVKVFVVLPQSLNERFLPVSEPTPTRIMPASPATEGRKSWSRFSVISVSSSVSSSSGGSSDRVHPPAFDRLALGLAQSLGTVAVVRGSASAWTEGGGIDINIPAFLSNIEIASARTQGITMCVISSMYMVSWNAGSHCPDHVAQCLCFLDLVCSRDTHTGATTGKLLHGNVLASRRRHAIVVGLSVELSVALSEEAEICEAQALLASQVGEYCEAEGRASRMSDWTDGAGKPLQVWIVGQQQSKAWERPARCFAGCMDSERQGRCSMHTSEGDLAMSPTSAPPASPPIVPHLLQ